MAFPTSPANGQIAVLNGITYTYASTTSSWTRNAATLPTLSVLTDTFTGDGSTISYSLSVAPSKIDFITVNIDGVSQLKTAYTLSANILTFTGIPDSGAVIEVKTWNASTVAVLTGLTYDSFTGDGSTVAYTLSTGPTSKYYTIVTIGGITQNKNNYSIGGTTLTFSTAPPNTSPIEVTTLGPAVNTAAAAGANTQVQFSNGSGLTASGNLTFDNSSNTLSTTNLVVTGNSTVIGNITLSGVLTGNASGLTSIAAANVTGQIANALVAGTVYTAEQPNITSVGTLTSLVVSGVSTFGFSTESIVPKAGATGVVVHDAATGATFYHTVPAATFTPNFTNVPTDDNRVAVLSIIIVQGATPYAVNSTTVQIEGVAYTVKWASGSAPTGVANKTDVVSYSFVRASAVWNVYGQYATYG